MARIGGTKDTSETTPHNSEMSNPSGETQDRSRTQTAERTSCEQYQASEAYENTYVHTNVRTCIHKYVRTYVDVLANMRLYTFAEVN
jgi:hypothetical protein